MATTDNKLGKLNEHLTFGLIASLSLGLAPFVPQPHVWQKIKMLYWGSLYKPIDIFDLLMHGAPWIFLLVTLARIARIKLDARKKAKS